jgi:dTDP-4-dehydrorhamnose 3,5-epimerase
MDGVILTPLKRIPHPKGEIFHAIKASDDGFSGFGEAYFSEIHKDETKGWKKHTEMTLNLIVAVGAVKFSVHNQETDEYFNTIISIHNYNRLTVKPGLWVSFTGIEKKNILLNVASIEHDSEESVNVSLESFNIY